MLRFLIAIRLIEFMAHLVTITMLWMCAWRFIFNGGSPFFALDVFGYQLVCCLHIMHLNYMTVWYNIRLSIKFCNSKVGFVCFNAVNRFFCSRLYADNCCRDRWRSGCCITKWIVFTVLHLLLGVYYFIMFNKYTDIID